MKEFKGYEFKTIKNSLFKEPRFKNDENVKVIISMLRNELEYEKIPETAMIRDLDAIFERFVADIAKYDELLLAFDRFLNFVNEQQKKQNLEPTLVISHTALHKMLVHKGLKKGNIQKIW